MRAIGAEFVKLFTTRVWLWLTVVVVGLTAIITTLVCVNINHDSGHPPVMEAVLNLGFIITPVAYVVACIIGITGLTGEFRHQTATSTFLAEPRRYRVVGAKLIVYLFYGALLGALTYFTILGLCLALLSGKGYDMSLSADSAYGFSDATIGIIATIALFAPFGVGLGALVRNQPTAITLSAIYLLVADKILLAFHSGQHIFPYSPGGAAVSLMFPGKILDDVFDTSSVDFLSRSGSALALVIWSLGWPWWVRWWR